VLESICYRETHIILVRFTNYEVGETKRGNGSCLLHCMKVRSDSSIIKLYICILT